MPTWIVLDDDPDILSIVEAMCTVWGVDIIKLRDGFQAMGWLTLFGTGGYDGPTPDLALLDIRMPGPQGYDVARELRKTPELENIAIVLMTAFRLSEEEKEEVMSMSQADLFIPKPLPRMFELQRLLQEAVRSRKEQSGSEEAPPQPVKAKAAASPAKEIDTGPLSKASGQKEPDSQSQRSEVWLRPAIAQAIERAATTKNLHSSHLYNLLLSAGLNLLSKGKFDKQLNAGSADDPAANIPEIPEEYQ